MTRFATRVIHAGEPRICGAVSIPVFQSSTFLHDPRSAAEGGYHEVRYARLSNTPGHLALQEKLAALEGAEAALLTSSGMAAISTTLLALLEPGDHVLAQEGLYGGTHTLLVRDLRRFGIECTFVDGNDPTAWGAARRPRTRLFYVEAMSNPLLQVADLPGIVEFCRTGGLLSVIDNTLATPVNFQPLRCGFDLCIHSCTKYLNGHSDLVAGVVVGGAALLTRIKHQLDRLGGALDPHACFLLHRGIKTVALRVRHQNDSALRIARFLSRHPAVRQVHYPGLESHPQHARAQALFQGFGGLLSLELQEGVAGVERLLSRTQLLIQAPSLGGVETLVTRPATTSHASLTPAERHRLGISDALLRISVGLEDPEDLIEDLAQALS
ncbi:MAG: aminotransferase class I/II-fold pyridoxal phosphate-dependent enzyme [Myxococcales bacterium]|nr:aminotransferase class I/II-fold pyridoxal phosphate-dependent enzyme [Myxococcota bacterium]MDW8281024.1 aminotransferase class I/II-fold pyridoxal phosphate-dependent enzyme [Myxococcales bacterium]